MNRRVAQPFQKPIQRRVVRDAREPQHPAQFAMLAQPHLGFAKGPVFVPHQAENGQQLRLRELVFAEATSVRGKNAAGNLQGHPRKRQESDFGHGPSCLIRKHPPPLRVDPSNPPSCRGCQQSLAKSKYCDSSADRDAILASATALASFNQSGDAITPSGFNPGAANPQAAQTAANKSFWDLLP